MLIAIARFVHEELVEVGPADREALHRGLRSHPAGVHQSVDEQRQLADELAGHAIDRARPDLHRHRAVLDDEHPGAFLAGVDQHMTAPDLERRRDGGDVRQREVVEIGEQ